MNNSQIAASQRSAGFEGEVGLRIGDRVEVFPAAADAGKQRLHVPEALALFWAEEPQIVIEDAEGRRAVAHYDPQTGSIVWQRQDMIKDTGPPRRMWLECVEPRAFRLVYETPGKRTSAALATETMTEQGVPITFDAGDLELLESDTRAQPVSLAKFDLSLRAAELTTHPGFDRLICLPLVREMEILEHQIKTAKTALCTMRGRALLCDEVGLGKTIEAGLILSELMVRGLVRSVLILTPPSLVQQWQAEMQRKFSIEFITHDDSAFRRRGTSAWGEFNHVLASFHTAKRLPHASAITQRTWDMVIIDEAHHLRNRNTRLWRFASELSKRFILMLTATPVQNKLEELFNLVTLLEPGLLSTTRRFQKRFVDRRDHLTPRNVDQLHDLLAEVMIRNRRSTVGLQLTRRWARTDRVELTVAEHRLYQDTADFVRRHLRQSVSGRVLSRMAMVMLQMELGSSAAAAVGTLKKLAAHERLDHTDRSQLMELAETAQNINQNTKADHLLGLLKELPDKLVVFTQFRATQEMLRRRLEQAGHSVALFHGGLGRLEKERQIERFRRDSRVLLTTDSGSEGRNLQFCNAVCNFDLPWNPMRIEQRIGRLSRIGQARAVYVFNLVATGTIESAILRLLEAKLAMFELVIGEIDMVLGNLDEKQEFADVVTDLWSESTDMDDFAYHMEQLGDRLVAAKEAYFQQRAIDDNLFSDRFQPKQ